MANPRFLNRTTCHTYKTMTKCCSIVVGVFLSFTLTGCAGTTSFRVLDAHTKEPIQGAVALAMWTKTKGLPGLTSRYTAKAIEAETNDNGFFTIPGVVGWLALQTPHLKVYKPGYVGWDSRLIYLGCKESHRNTPLYKTRESFSMENQVIYMEPWKDDYTFISHDGFIAPYADLYGAGIKESIYRKAIRYEVPFYLSEKEALHKNKRK